MSWDTPPPRQSGWQSLRGAPLPVQLVLAGVALVIVGVLVVGALSGDDGPSPEYTRALDQCQATAGIAWLAAHPNADTSDPASVTNYAAAINRCLVDTMHVDPKYLPDKPIAP